MLAQLIPAGFSLRPNAAYFNFPVEYLYNLKHLNKEQKPFCLLERAV